METYPWPNPGEPEWPNLLRLRPEDVGYDSQTASSAANSTTAQTVDPDKTPQPQPAGATDPLVINNHLCQINLVYCKDVNNTKSIYNMFYIELK